MTEERRTHSLETKVAVVKAVHEDGRGVREVADEFQIAQSLVHIWVNRFRKGEPLEKPRGAPPNPSAPRSRVHPKKKVGRPKAAPQPVARVAPSAQLALPPKPNGAHHAITTTVVQEVADLKAENRRLKKKVQQLLALMMDD